IGSSQVLPVVTQAVPVEPGTSESAAIEPRYEAVQVPPLQPPHPPMEIAISQSNAFRSVLEPRPVSVNYEPLTGFGEPGKVSREIISYHQPESAIAMQYQALVERLLQDEAGKILLLTGVRPSVGASTVILNLAIAAALRLQKRVAVVETQRRRPSLAGKLGL